MKTADEVRAHLWEYRDDLRRSVIAYSGGKDSQALARLIHEVEPSVPLVYAGCPGAEWPEHEAHVRDAGAEILDTGHGWEWWASNLWAVLHTSARDAERWARLHHRGQLRRYALDRGLILLWGNRTADGNNVPAVRYQPRRSPPLWMPLRDIGDAECLRLAGPLSPVYGYRSTGGTGYPLGRLRDYTREERVADAEAHLPTSQLEAFRKVIDAAAL